MRLQCNALTAQLVTCIREENRESIEFFMRTVCNTLAVPCPFCCTHTYTHSHTRTTLAAAKKAATEELQRVRHAAEMELAAVQKQARRDVRERDARIVENEAEIEELRRRVRTLEAELETLQKAEKELARLKSKQGAPPWCA